MDLKAPQKAVMFTQTGLLSPTNIFVQTSFLGSDPVVSPATGSTQRGQSSVALLKFSRGALLHIA